MKNTKLIIILIIILFALLIIFFILWKPPREGQIINNPPSPQPERNIVRIANWNLQVFGQSKASKPELMAKYVAEIDKNDIIFIQEIRDSTGTAFQKLCSLLPQYDCTISSRAGQTSSKEQYGVIYRKGIQLVSTSDFNPQYQSEFQRPPILVIFNLSGYDLSIYNIHIDPDLVASELGNLESIVNTDGNVMIIGDLNADCSYYNPSTMTEFDSWSWVIGDNEDTTVSSTDCAYDRIILNDNAKGKLVSYGIDRNVSSDMSDHYLVWAEMQT